MPFLFLGAIVFIIGIYFYIAAVRENDRDGKIGTMGLIIAGLLLMLIYGLFYQVLSKFGG